MNRQHNAEIGQVESPDVDNGIEIPFWKGSILEAGRRRSTLSGMN